MVFRTWDTFIMDFTIPNFGLVFFLCQVDCYCEVRKHEILCIALSHCLLFFVGCFFNGELVYSWSVST